METDEPDKAQANCGYQASGTGDNPWSTGEQLAGRIERGWASFTPKEKTETLIEGLIFAAAIVAAVAALGQMSASTEAIRTSRDTTQAIERPWVLFDKSPPDDPSTPETEGNFASEQAVSVYVVNFGRSPAFGLRWAIWIPSNFAKPIGKNRLPKRGWIRKPGSAILPPGKSLQIITYWEGFPTHPEPKEGEPFWALIAVHYSDAFGHRHRTRFCVLGTISQHQGNVLNCYAYNHAD